MSSRIKSREDIRNILLAIYAAKLPPPGEEKAPESNRDSRLRLWGCRAAVQALMLACGLPLRILDQAGQILPPDDPATPPATSQHWWVEDLENVIAAIYRSAMSTPVQDMERPHVEQYRRGFGEVIVAFLEAIGSYKDPCRWLDESPADRQWIFPYEPTGLEGGESWMNVVGSPVEGPDTP